MKEQREKLTIGDHLPPRRYLSREEAARWLALSVDTFKRPKLRSSGLWRNPHSPTLLRNVGSHPPYATLRNVGAPHDLLQSHFLQENAGERSFKEMRRQAGSLTGRYVTNRCVNSHMSNA